MKRRRFLQVPLIFSSLTTFAQSLIKDRSRKGIKVEAGKDRFGKPSFKQAAATIHCKVSIKDTDGDMCSFETTRTEKGGPPFHIHHHQDEWFFVMEGEYKIKVGDEIFYCKAGDSVFAPRKVPHGFAKIGEGTAKMILVYQPGGSMEEYFYDVSKYTSPPSQEEMNRLFKKHDMEVLGPPLAID